MMHENIVDRLGKEGLELGYDVNPLKSLLVVKPLMLDEAKPLFNGTRVRITPDRRRHLGVPLYTQQFVRKFIL